MIRVGSRIALVNTGNDHLPDGTPAVVSQMAEWGAHVRTAATVTSRYRAGWHEMAEDDRQEATGDMCDVCGGSNLVRAGTCMVCRDCGGTSGCS